jgi:cardiolipin synthase
MIFVNTVLMSAPYAVAVTEDISPSAAAAISDSRSVSMFDGIWTIPNAFTLLRLLLLPVFLYVLFGLENRAAAALLLGGLSATDWVDGYLARRLGQVSEFGKVFDPTVDRLLFVVATIAIIIDGSIPLWFALAVLFREVAVGLMMAIATLVYKMPRIDVTYLGKLATFLLMFAVPGFLMGNSDIAGADAFEVAAWLVGIPGLILSYWTGIAYIPQVRRAVAEGAAARSTSTTSDS